MRLLPIRSSRRFLLALIIAVVSLSACVTNNQELPDDVTATPETTTKGERADLDRRLSAWETAMRSEFTFLWDNVNALRAARLPPEGSCNYPDFGRSPVEATETLRARDRVGADIIDQLAYADVLLLQARDKWIEFCGGGITSGDAVAFMDTRLSPAYQSLNLARNVLDERAAQLNR